MLPKAHRLWTKQFDHVWKRGTSACGAFVCVRVVTSQSDLRCACIAPKKHAPTAVQRNHIKRRLYGALAPSLSQSDTTTHMIISPKNDLKNATFKMLRDDVAQTIAKAHSRTKDITK